MTIHLNPWLGFHLFLLALLLAELLLVRRRRLRSTQTSALALAIWMLAALLFAAVLWHTRGPHPATEFLAGYTIEQALSVDNLFVFLVLFRAFRILPANQPRVLFWGVAGAILLRGLLIALGLGLLARFHWVSYLFGSVLLVAAFRLLPRKSTQDANQPPRWLAWLSRVHPISLQQDRFFAVEDGRRLATVLLLALIAIELTDVVFALDSIPAVLSITRDHYLAYTSNILAVLSLRAMFFLLAHFLERLRFLHLGLATVLAFAAIKILAAPWHTIGPLPSLAVILGVLLVTIVLSLAGRPTDQPPPQPLT